MRSDVAGQRVPAAVAEGVELLDIAELQRGLLGDPGAQARLERAVGERIERAEGQAVGLARRLAATTRISGCWSATATIAALRPISIGGGASFIQSSLPEREREGDALERQLAAADRRDRRDHAALAAEQPVGDARRSAGWAMAKRDAACGAVRAISRSSRSGRATQSVMKAAAVDRLMPA